MELIKKRFGVKICRSTLQVFYRKNNVRFRKPQYVYFRKEKKKEELKIEQKKVSVEIGDLI